MLRLKPAPAANESLAATREAAASVEIVADFQDPYLELLRLLREAAEIEHALMVQYLYAAFSIRPEYSRLQGSFSASARNLMGVAIQEMHHLDEVNRLRTALGGSPSLERQDFPYEPDLYPFPFHLERLGPESVAKYTWTEAPAGVLDPDTVTPDDQSFLDRLNQALPGEFRPNHLGSIYGAMIKRLNELAEASPGRLPDVTSWVERLAAIKDEGEGDHFRFFKSVFMGTHPAFPEGLDVWSLDPDDPRYPSFPVPKNPSALTREDSDRHGPAHRKAWLGDLHYWLILMLLDLSYRHGAPLLATAIRHMVEPLWTLGNDLAASNRGLPFDPLSMGYAPGRDRQGSLEVVRRLAVETGQVAADLEDQGELPVDYPSDINEATASQITQLEAM